ncbi:GntR family transcriptional regulator [Halobacillus sp. MO56]
MKLDKGLPIPLYHQVIEILETKIANGEWKVGDQIPTENELAKHFSISNITVKRAVHELVDKGLLYRQRGKGTFVAPQFKEAEMYKLLSFGSEKEYPHQTIKFSIEEAGEEAAKWLNISNIDPVINLSRLKMDGDKPVGVEHIYLNYQLCPTITQESMENQLIYDALKAENIKLGRTKIDFSALNAGNAEVEMLNIEKNTPLISIQRTTFTEKDQIIECSRFLLGQDHAHYSIEFSF